MKITVATVEYNLQYNLLIKINRKEYMKTDKVEI